MATYVDRIEKLFEGMFNGPVPNDYATAAKNLVKRGMFVYTKAVDGASGTAVAEVAIWKCPAKFASGVTITKVSFTPSTTLATAATDYVTTTMSRRTGASLATKTTITSITSNTGGTAQTAWAEIVMSLTDTTLLAGDVVTFTNAVTASGKAMPGGVFEFEYDII